MFNFRKNQLQGKNIKSLKELAKKNGLSGYSSLKKEELVNFILEEVAWYKFLERKLLFKVLGGIGTLIALWAGVRSCYLDEVSLAHQQSVDLISQAKPELVITQNNPRPQDYKITDIEIPYVILNSSNVKAKNVNLNVYVPYEAYVWFTSDKFKQVNQEYNSLVKDTSTIILKDYKILEFQCEQFNPGDFAVMYVSIDKIKFVKENGTLPLKIGTKIPVGDQTIPYITDFYSDKGMGKVLYADSLELTYSVLLNARIDLENKLKNGYSIDDVNVRKTFAINYLEDLIRFSQYVFSSIKMIDEYVKQSDGATKVTENFLIPSLPYLDEIQKDTIVAKFISSNLNSYILETIELKNRIDNLWNNSYELDKKRIIRMLNVYFNQVEILRVLLNVELSLVKGKINNQEHNSAFVRYMIIRNVKNHSGDRDMVFDESVFNWRPNDTLLEKYAYENYIELY